MERTQNPGTSAIFAIALIWVFVWSLNEPQGRLISTQMEVLIDGCEAAAKSERKSLEEVFDSMKVLPHSGDRAVGATLQRRCCEGVFEVITYSGIHVTQDFGAPCVRDIAIQLMRVCRFCGSGEKWWPVGMHCLCVADLAVHIAKSKGLDARLMVLVELDGLLHDSEESTVSDVPKPMKTTEQRTLGNKMRERIYSSLGLREMPQVVKEITKRADLEIVCAEGSQGFGPRGFAETQTDFYQYWTNDAISTVKRYGEVFDPMQAIVIDGGWQRQFEQRILQALREYHAIDYTEAA